MQNYRLNEFQEDGRCFCLLNPTFNARGCFISADHQTRKNIILSIEMCKKRQRTDEGWKPIWQLIVYRMCMEFVGFVVGTSAEVAKLTMDGVTLNC